MGMQTVEELVDIVANEDATAGVGKAGVAGLKERLAKPVESKDITEPEVAPEPPIEEIEADNAAADEQLDELLPSEPVLGKPDEAEEPTALRYYCKHCDNEMDNLAPNNLCRKCLTGDKIIDRRI